MAIGSDTRGIETNGINEIDVSEHRGSPRELFWPWFAANVSVLGLSYGSFILSFGISFWQATAVAIVGIVVSFLLCGFVALAGKRGHAPTMTLSRAAFGVNGNRVPSALSWLLTLGWETVLVSLAVLATAGVFGQLGWSDGAVTKVVALAIVVALVVGAGIIGIDFILRMQKYITIVTGILTIVYFVLIANRIDMTAVMAIPAGHTPAVVGALVFTMTGFGLGWVNAAADYSRYLPRGESGRGVVAWTTLGASIAPVLLVIVGLLLAASSADLSTAIAADPIGALATVLPTWFLVPFIVVAMLGLVGGAIMNIYSSGLSLINAGVKVPRPVAVGIDGTVMTIGAIYVVFFADSFLGPFQGFLITLGVPIAAWCGIFLGDMVLRKKSYDADALFTPTGRYGSVRIASIALIVVGTVVGFGLVTNSSASWLSWQGYLLDAVGLGGRTGEWAFANIGVLAALLIGFLGTLILNRSAVGAQERS